MTFSGPPNAGKRGRLPLGLRTREPAFDAFISYSHAADGRLAPRLQDGLHRLARPLFRPRALRVFRDETGLSATPGLWPSIERALDRSRYFILMASPDAARSKWVGDEIGYWLTKSPAAKEGTAAQRFLIVLSGGDIEWNDQAGGFNRERTTALPERLLAGVFAHEPLWVDVGTEEQRFKREEQRSGRLAFPLFFRLFSVPPHPIPLAVPVFLRGMWIVGWSP